MNYSDSAGPCGEEVGEGDDGFPGEVLLKPPLAMGRVGTGLAEGARGQLEEKRADRGGQG